MSASSRLRENALRAFRAAARRRIRSALPRSKRPDSWPRRAPARRAAWAFPDKSRETPDAARGWDNLGHWAEATSYPEACRALVRCVGQAAALQPGQRLVDVGIGWGQQLKVWRDDFGISSVIGLEPDGERAREAAARMPNAVVVTAAADALGDVVEGRVDAVVSVDAAYFFRARTRFYAGAFDRLRPGGRLVLTDLLVERPSLLTRAEARLCGIPPTNIRDAAGHQRWLEDAGFSEVRVTSLEPWVLAGFANWALKDPAMRRSLRHRVTATLIWRLAGRVSYGLLVATKPLNILE